MKKKLVIVLIDLIVATAAISFFVIAASSGEMIVMFGMGILVWATLFKYLEARTNFLYNRFC